MELFEAIEKRHTYRSGYAQGEVPRDHLRQIVDAGIRAPSAHNNQSTSFIIVDEPELLESVLACVSKAKYLEGARAAIVVLMDPKPAPGKDIAFGVEDYAAAVENMLLAITALGYATVWTDGALRRHQAAERIATLLGVPDSLLVRVLLPIGVPAKAVKQRKKKPFQERAFWNRYGAGDATAN